MWADIVSGGNGFEEGAPQALGDLARSVAFKRAF